MNDTTVQDLGDGLILRRATSADVEALVDFDARVHSDAGWDSPDPGVAAWVRDLMAGSHPTFDVGDFLVVEDPARTTDGQPAIVSSTNLISQTWTYAGIPFGVGRIELVGTHPDYRRRGLVRKQFEVLHRWSAERGELIQAITGIPWYYRQFGYDMALNLHGARRGPEGGLPDLKEGATEPYAIRPATVADLAFIAEVETHGQRRSLVNCVRDAAQWAYDLSGRTPRNAAHAELRIIETTPAEGAAPSSVGFLAHPPVLWGSTLFATRYELLPGTSWWAVTPSVLRYLQATGATLPPYMADPDGGPTFKNVGFELGEVHPAYAIVTDWLPIVQASYTWYMRVPDLPAFLRLIAPALEARLGASDMAGHSKKLNLDFYRGGVSLTLSDGHITEVAGWPAERDSVTELRAGGAYARFPDFTFLQVLFGHRTLGELRHAYTDCSSNLEGRLLVDALFAKQSSEVWPIA